MATATKGKKRVDLPATEKAADKPWFILLTNKREFGDVHVLSVDGGKTRRRDRAREFETKREAESLIKFGIVDSVGGPFLATADRFEFPPAAPKRKTRNILSEFGEWTVDRDQAVLFEPAVNLAWNEDEFDRLDRARNVVRSEALVSGSLAIWRDPEKTVNRWVIHHRPTGTTIGAEYGTCAAAKSGAAIMRQTVVNFDGQLDRIGRGEELPREERKAVTDCIFRHGNVKKNDPLAWKRGMVNRTLIDDFGRTLPERVATPADVSGSVAICRFEGRRENQWTLIHRSSGLGFSASFRTRKRAKAGVAAMRAEVPDFDALLDRHDSQAPEESMLMRAVVKKHRDAS